MNDTMRFRPGHDSDLPAIVELYNHYVCHSHVTFDDVPLTTADRTPWFRQFDADSRHQLWIAEDTPSGNLLGYASTTRFRPKPCYRSSVESSVYLAPQACGQGVGRALYQRLFASLADHDVHRVLAGVALPNPASIALHESLGFARIGLFSDVGFKFDRFWDVAWYERPFP